ncbi:MAG: alpha/beta hydrolase [Proteobacteria bacterium]|nr:alpha/beta hydrolase [Pseudomonadota bacterium]
MRRSLVTLMIGLSALPGGEVFAEGIADLGPPVTLTRTATFDVAGAGGSFRVLVAMPDAPPPPEGYRAIYALDAGWTFGTLLDQLALRGTVPPAGAPTLVIALGWPTDTLIDTSRRGPDLTGDNAAATLEVLTDVVIPRVEASLPVDPKHRMILGHSFGGAFALRAGLSRPDLFSHIAAGSPSIWTEPDWFLHEAVVPQGQQRLITLGALETPEAASASGEPADRVARLKTRDMAGRASAMADRLGITVTLLPGASHGGSLAPFLARAIESLWH